MRRRQQLRLEGGQVLLVVAIALPLFFTVCAFVVDGANLMVHRRSIQNAADAAALAAARGLAGYQNVTPGIATCDSSWASEKSIEPRKTIIPDVVEEYSTRNDGPSTLDGGSCSWDDRRCSDSGDSNCYTWPYKGNNGLLEVRLREHVGGFFATVAHLSLFDVSARAVASVAAITEDHCVFTPPDVVDPDQYLNTDPPCSIPPGQPTTGTYVAGVDGAQSFTMSRACDAIFVTGADGAVLGGLGTNGGLTFGSVGSTPKKARTLGSNRTGCPNAPISPPSGDSTQCTAIAWGDATNSNNLCVKTLIDWSAQVPMNWPVPPPTIPTPLASGTWSASTDYPGKCTNLGTTDVRFTPASTFTISGGGGIKDASGPPGIYCLTGTDKELSLAGDFETFGSQEGYTFFALNNSRIHVNSNGTRVKFYYPNDASCGSRPTSRPSSFTCFGRTVSSYDPQTMFYSTNTFHDNTKGCDKNAVCIDGQNTRIDGDIFAPSPNTFPPPNPATQTGGTIFMAGGGASAGSGFLESWWLTVQGNNGTYNGTGPSIGAHCVFNPPVVNPDQYLPSCVIPGSPARNGNRVTNVVGANLGMDE